MDPVTHSVLGITCALAVTRRPEHRRAAAVAGLAAGLWPDADIFLRSADDPLFALEYHRHFTHSLAFSPVVMLAGAASAWLLLALFRRRTAFLILLWPALVAVWSHIFCDVWTSYGTRVLWPFREDRLTLDLISVIDPLMTLPLAFFALRAVWKKSRSTAWAGLGWAAAYLGVCLVQQQRAMTALETWIASRGERAERITVKPSFGNIVVWRGLYLAGGQYHAAAIRPGFPGDVRLLPGETVPALPGPGESREVWNGFEGNSVIVKDVARFYHFSDEWVGWHPGKEGQVLGDLRYAELPHVFRPLWGIGFDRQRPDRHVDWLTFRRMTREPFVNLWEMICGRGFPEPGSLTAPQAPQPESKPTP